MSEEKLIATVPVPIILKTSTLLRPRPLYIYKFPENKN